MLLLIDTSGDKATVLLTWNGKVTARAENDTPRDHSGWLHPAIAGLMGAGGAAGAGIRAVAVTAGPGSYTGLRVGMAAAKGICYALGIPLIACNNLLLMAAAMKQAAHPGITRFCPMIDARRMEVFTATYSSELEVLVPPRALILDKTSFETELGAGEVLFAGSGSKKWEEFCSSPTAYFLPQLDIIESFIEIATTRFHRAEWTNTAYSEPEYGKEFHTHEIK